MIDIVDYEGLYAVSEVGLVWSYRRAIWLKPFVNNVGYQIVRLFKDGKPKCFLVHRLVASAYCSKKPGATDVNHLDCDKLNNRASNLEWCSHRENVAHAVKAGKYRNHGRYPRANHVGVKQVAA